MKQHFCPAEQSMIAFEKECNWCGELESQEPFGIWHQGATDEESDFYLYSESGDVSCPNCIKLYTHPPQRTWVGLTDEERNDLCYDFGEKSLWSFADSIEAKLKEKNT